MKHRLPRAVMCCTTILVWAMMLCGCESDDKSDSQETNTNLTASQPSNDDPAPSLKETLTPYFGNWTGSTNFTAEGTNYTTSAFTLAIVPVSSDEITATIDPAADIFNQSDGASVESVYLLGGITTEKHNWDNNAKAVTLSGLSWRSGNMALIVVFTTPTTALMTVDLLSGFTLPLTKAP